MVMTIEDRVNRICSDLPEGWAVRIDLEQDPGSVTTIRPDKSEVQMSDGESDISEQLGHARQLAWDEYASDHMPEPPTAPQND